MKPQSVDTHPDAENAQIQLLRSAGTWRRFEMTRSVSNTVIRISRSAISTLHPEMEEREIGLRFVAFNYGEELARKLRVYFREMKP